MSNKLYVGNLAFETTESDLNELFSGAGTVREASVITDKMTGNSRGFAFVVMGNTHDAETAITQFNDRDLHGRNITVNIAREREQRPAGGGHNHDRRPARRY